MKPAFKQLLQIGMIVRDVDATVAHFESMGMGPWDVHTMSNEAPMTDLRVDQKPVEGPVAKMGFLNAFGIEFELIEPIADTNYKAWLDEHGPGIHHIAVVTEDDYDTVLENYRAHKGEEPWLRGQGLDGLMDFSYLDLRDELGIFIECYRNIKPGRPRIEYDYRDEKYVID